MSKMTHSTCIISGDLDGADLRREVHFNIRYLRCNGSHDDNQINEALQSIGKSDIFSIPASSWERIFARGHKR